MIALAALATAAGFATSARVNLVQSQSRSTRLLAGVDGQPKAPKSELEHNANQLFKAGAAIGSVFLQQTVANAEAAAAAAGDKGEVDGEAEALDPYIGYITTGSGLKYKDLKVGEGAAPAGGDTVRVHYTGWLDGFESPKKFDSSYDRRSPLVFKAGVGQVVKGWDEALLTDMKVGTVRNVVLPPELGYGARGAGGVIPPNATLYFKMELVGIGAR